MEQELLQTSQKSPRYQRFRDTESFKKGSITAKEEKVKKELIPVCYLGYEKADKIIDDFGFRDFAENWVDGTDSLLKLEHKHPPTEMIIADSRLGYQAICELRKFLNSHPRLALIPFVVDEKGMTPETKMRFRKERIADEIICLENFEGDSEKLLTKARFLKKIKTGSQNLEWKRNIQTSSSIPGSGSIPKRIFDIIVAIVALVLLSPVLLLIALAIKIESRGPVFYIAKRAGRGYRIFNFYKFRTMVVDADKQIQNISHLNQYNASTDGPTFFKVENDPRITKVGAFLRKTSLDELPQFVNVLLGDMSLVGNRPLPLYEAATLTTDMWAERFMAPAGITGLWQITKRGNKDMSVEERIKLDIAYVNDTSFTKDLVIMMRTPTALIQKTNV